MTRKSEKTLYDFKMNIWQATNHEIRIKIVNPFDHGKKEHMSCVEHNDKHHGNHMSRTHNDLFKFFKTIIEGEGLWTNIETKLGKKRKVIKNEDIDLGNKYGVIYMTTNTVNGMRYIGKHSRNDENYLGSGTKFKEAVLEFGKENFEREDIAFAYSAEQLNVLEKYYIDIFKAFSDPTFYNSAPGGDGWYGEKVVEGEVCS
ncbi:hypothetical protein ACTHO4_27380 [Peribacillus frigoritolerans]